MEWKRIYNIPRLLGDTSITLNTSIKTLEISHHSNLISNLKALEQKEKKKKTTAVGVDTKNNQTQGGKQWNIN